MKAARVMTACPRIMWAAPMAFGALLLTTIFFCNSRPAVASYEGSIERPPIASIPDRVTGTQGADKAARLIGEEFEAAGLQDVDVHEYILPIPVDEGSEISLRGDGQSVTLFPLFPNLVTTSTTPPGGVEGPLIYAGEGRLADFNGKGVEGAVVLIDAGAGSNWTNVPMLGGKGAIFIGDPGSRLRLEDAIDPTPLTFPRFWMDAKQAQQLYPQAFDSRSETVPLRVQIRSKVTWRNRIGRNVYGLLPGVNPHHENELVIVDAFYDATPLVLGRTPGADEAASAEALLSIMQHLVKKPPGRSVLFLATSGHAQALHGMREFVWAVITKPKQFHNDKKRLVKKIQEMKNLLKAIRSGKISFNQQDALGQSYRTYMGQAIKNRADDLSNQIRHLRMVSGNAPNDERLRSLLEQHQILRRISLVVGSRPISDESRAALSRIEKEVEVSLESMLEEARLQLKALESTLRLKEKLKSYKIKAVLSLHLSSGSRGLGAFSHGWFYNRRDTAADREAFTSLSNLLDKLIQKIDGKQAALVNALQPAARRNWRSYLGGEPFFNSEVAVLGGLLGVTFATTDDVRLRWGTPSDGISSVRYDYLEPQVRLLKVILPRIIDADSRVFKSKPRKAFSVLEGTAKFIRAGELFPDRPGRGAIVTASHGKPIMKTAVDWEGEFKIKGVASKKVVYEKVLIELFGLNEEDGRIHWAVIKERTGKSNYRVKVKKRRQRISLILFPTRASTSFSALSPRDFSYLRKMHLLDARRESRPLRNWYSRVDTLRSTYITTYLEEGTPYKVILSDNFLSKKLLLLNGSPEHPEGDGFIIDKFPTIPFTPYQVASDMWKLGQLRLRNLEEKGIKNPRVEKLHTEAGRKLERSRYLLAQRIYSGFIEAARSAWAFEIQVYNELMRIQQDVLVGVLFYIALFFPFAYCIERLLFGFSDIRKRIIAFVCILLATIWIVKSVHPAFEMTYSPAMVILAFFVMTLSLIVSLIIFIRMEDEVADLHRQALHIKVSEVKKSKAFAAAFSLGVSNLKRHKARTALTCLTLVILTFTIMSFTNIKTLKKNWKVEVSSEAPYKGMLVRSFLWNPFPEKSFQDIGNALGEKGRVFARAWLGQGNLNWIVRVDIHNPRNGGTFTAEGLLGMEAADAAASHLEKIVQKGQWFGGNTPHSLLLPRTAAEKLGIDANNLPGATVSILGTEFRVAGIFDGSELDALFDLDGEPLTPVVYPVQRKEELTPVEVEAMQEGEDIGYVRGRYQHVPGSKTVIMPFSTLLGLGGQIRSVVFHPHRSDMLDAMSDYLLDRFSLPLFIGSEQGSQLVYASDSMRYLGAPNVLIPLLISALIVLNTMIGAVFGRRREIAVYTSVGLAPNHIGFLFVTEALALGIISVTAGYLLAQGIAGFLTNMGMLGGITLNYSSKAGVASMVLVLSTAVLSTLYPARMASQIAIQDVSARTELPPPTGDRIHILMPFIMHQWEWVGLAGYLEDFFLSRKDLSHGVFSVEDARFVSLCQFPCGTGCNREACFQLLGRVWLAPFDFGVKQNVTVVLCPSKTESGFLEVKIDLERLSGEKQTWIRTNQVFLYMIRKHLLIWRSVDDEAKREYANRVTAALADAKRFGVKC
ncbi:MAG: peptide ABC transporter permease [Deltaproteobacteria bacterium]|nr:peptide ABC transporter permease [Deltaproteobacteria bacterium]